MTQSVAACTLCLLGFGHNRQVFSRNDVTISLFNSHFSDDILIANCLKKKIPMFTCPQTPRWAVPAKFPALLTLSISIVTHYKQDIRIWIWTMITNL